MRSCYKFISALFFLTFLGIGHTAYCANDSIYEARRQAYINTALVNPGSDAMPIQAYMGVPIDSATLQAMLNGVATGQTSDFEYEQLVRILILAPGVYDSLILPYLRPVHYWVNNDDTLDCYWSENHMIQWMSSNWLLHEYYGIPADVNLRARLVHYLQMKIQYNYYEFFSSVYNPYCLAGLLNLADFSQDTVIKNLAIQASQRLMKNFLILTTDQGVFFPTAGRNYADKYEAPYGQNHNNVIWLLTGLGQAPGGASHCGGFLSTSTIPVDPVIQTWVPVIDTTYIVGQTLANAYAQNAFLDSLDRIVFQWSAGAYFNPEFAEESFVLISDSDMWHNSVFSVFLPLSTLPASLVPSLAEQLSVASTSSELYSDTLVVFKHNSISLSSVQNYWPGKWGYQQYPCVAAVGTAAVYTGSGPVAYDWNNRSATNQNDDLPYVKQVKNVAFIQYRPQYKPPILGPSDSTVALHWYIGAYTETRNDSLWLLSRQDNNYVAVRRPVLAQQDSLWICDKTKPYDGQTWIIIVGDSAMYGSFSNFQAVIDSSHFTEQWHFDTATGQLVYYASISIDSINIQNAWSADTSDKLPNSVQNVKPDQQGMNIYPNPANGNVNVVLGSTAVNGTVEVFNMIGQMIYQSPVNDSSVNISTSQWGEGLYAVRVTTDSGTISRSFVVSH